MGEMVCLLYVAKRTAALARAMMPSTSMRTHRPHTATAFPSSSLTVAPLSSCLSALLLDLIRHLWPRGANGFDKIRNDLVARLLPRRLDLLYLSFGVLVGIALCLLVAARLL